MASRQQQHLGESRPPSRSRSLFISLGPSLAGCASPCLGQVHHAASGLVPSTPVKVFFPSRDCPRCAPSGNAASLASAPSFLTAGGYRGVEMSHGSVMDPFSLYRFIDFRSCSPHLHPEATQGDYQRKVPFAFDPLTNMPRNARWPHATQGEFFIPPQSRY